MTMYEDEQLPTGFNFDHSYNELQEGQSWMNVDANSSLHNIEVNKNLHVASSSNGFSPLSQYSNGSPNTEDNNRRNSREKDDNFLDSPATTNSAPPNTGGGGSIFPEFVPRATGMAAGGAGRGSTFLKSKSWSQGRRQGGDFMEPHVELPAELHSHSQTHSPAPSVGNSTSSMSTRRFSSAFATAFQLSIPSSSTEQDKDGCFIAFRITVHTHFSKLEVKRRYRNFRQLHHDLLNRLDSSVLPPLPTKRYTSNTSDSYMTYDHYNTRIALQKYLLTVGALPEAWQCSSFVDFIDCRDPFLGLQVLCTGLIDDITELRQENAFLNREFYQMSQTMEEATRAISVLQRQLSQLDPQQKQEGLWQPTSSSVDELSPHANAFSPPSRQTPYTSGNNLPNQYSYQNQGDMRAQEDRLHTRPPPGLSHSNTQSPARSISPNSDHFETVSLRSLPPTMRSRSLKNLERESLRDTFQHQISSSSLSSRSLQTDDDGSNYSSSHPTSPTSRNSFHRPFENGFVGGGDDRPGEDEKKLIETDTSTNTEPVLDENAFAKFFGLGVDSLASSTESTLQGLPVSSPPKSPPRPIGSPSLNSKVSVNTGPHEEKPNRMISLIKPIGSGSTPFISAYLHIDVITKASTIPELLKFSSQMVQMMLPSTEQLLYRYNIEKYISKLVRKSLGAQLYQTGLNSLRCFLPDDPIPLSVYLCRGLEHSWYIRLNEKLSRMSVGGGNTGATETGGDNDEDEEDEGPGGGGENTKTNDSSPYPSPSTSPEKVHASQSSTQSTSSAPVSAPATVSSPSSSVPIAFGSASHPITNVNVITDDVESVLQCVVGNTTVNIRANMKLDLCFAAFLEEIDQSVGKGHLFKKSLTLVRAWWIYESPKYEDGLLNPEIIPKTALCIMVCAVFNLYKETITSPIHVLMLFLAEFSDFDWNTYALTIFGRVKRNLIEALPYSSFVKKNGSLFSAPIIQRYQKILKGNSSTAADLCDRTSDPTTEFSHSTVPTSPSSSSMPPKSAIFTLFERIEDDENEPNTSQENAEYVGSSDIKIYHPLEPSVNVISETILPSNIEGFHKMIQGGATRMNDILKQYDSSVDSDTNNKDAKLSEDMNDFFAVTMHRFGSGWRPDVVGAPPQDDEKDLPSPNKLLASMSYSSCEGDVPVIGSGGGLMSRKVLNLGNDTSDKDKDKDKDADQDFYEEIGHDPLLVPIEVLAEKIKHCSFLLEAQVTEPVLQRLSKEILQERGPLPVGEIGKMLQEMTSISTLSAYLKEKYGGLKKFLELFEDMFVISVDHPFNPHVFLRNTLMPDDIAAIAGGSIPMHLSTKANKRRLSRRKRLSSQGSTSSERGSASPHPMLEQRSRSLTNVNFQHHSSGNLQQSNGNSHFDRSHSNNSLHSRNHSASSSRSHTPPNPAANSFYGYAGASRSFSPPPSGSGILGGGMVNHKYHSNNNYNINPNDDRRRQSHIDDTRSGRYDGGDDSGMGSHDSRRTIPNQGFQKEYQQQQHHLHHQQQHAKNDGSQFDYFDGGRNGSGGYRRGGRM